MSISPWHLVNTRPVERANDLSQALRQQGYQVTDLPLLELVAEGLDAKLTQQLEQIVLADVVVVVSPKAATLGLAHLETLGIDVQRLACQWIAVGRGTATVLQQAGLAPLIPQLQNSEGILNLPVLQQLACKTCVMFWRGYGGRELVLQTLQQADCQVISINLYHRQLPDNSALKYQQLLQNKPQVLLISSGVSWQNWLALAEQSGQSIELAYIIVLGERIYQRIRQWLGQQSPAQSGNPSTRPLTSGSIKSRVVLLQDLQTYTILNQLKILQKCQQT